MLNYWNALNHLKCVEFCVFPFIRVGHSTTALINTTLIEEKRKTNLKYIFRARELCELMPVIFQIFSSLTRLGHGY